VWLRDSRHVRLERRARRRTNLADLERLEARDLMAFSSLGFSLPDLTISGVAGSPAAWGGTLGLTATVDNIGSSSITNPIAQAPGNLSTADAPESRVAVLITPHRNSLNGAIQVGTFEAPALSQNSLEQITASVTLPSRPAGFARPGGRFFVRLVANSDGSVYELNQNNNLSRPIPVRVVSTALPELRAVALGVPATMQPGDTIVPQITIANFGSAPSGTPVQVALVASTSKSFTVGSSIIALYDIETSIPGAYQTGDNTLTFTGPAVTLPTSPSTYFIGVVVDPNGQINQLSTPTNVFEQIHVVGPANSGLPPAGVVSSANDEPFPLPPTGTFIGISPAAGANTSTIQTSPSISSV
jgi:hypothetical protein